jgi:hypothetical protein
MPSSVVLRFLGLYSCHFCIVFNYQIIRLRDALLVPGVGCATMVVMLLLCIGQFPSIMVAFIHQNSKRPKFSFASKAIAPKALRSFDLWCELPQLNYAYYPLLLDINLSQLLPLN